MTDSISSDLAVPAERVETATGPSRELDGEIWEAIGLTDDEENHCRDWCRQDGRTDLTRERFLDAWAPHYTASIDDALMLLPDEWHFSSMETFGYGAVIEARVGNKIPGGGQWIGARAAALPLALCAAALRARGAS